MTATPDGTLTVPLFALGPRSIAGLRTSMLTLGEPPIAGVDSGAGLGSSALWLWYTPPTTPGPRTEYTYVDGRHLLAAWLARRAAGDMRARGVLRALGHDPADPRQPPDLGHVIAEVRQLAAGHYDSESMRQAATNAMANLAVALADALDPPREAPASGAA